MREPRLLIRLGSLGDVVLATAAANAGRRRWGDGWLDVLVKSEWETLWENHPAVRKIHSLPPRDRGLRKLRDWGERLRAENYVQTFDLQSSPRTRLLAGLAGLKDVRRPRRFNRRRRLLVTTKRWGPPGDFSVGRAFAATVSGDTGALPSLHPGEPPRTRAAALIPEAGRGVGLIPGARHHTKRWPLERFVEVGRHLHREGTPVAVFFGPDEDALRERWGAAWPDPLAWTEIRQDLVTVAACLGRLRAVVTNDTGLMHMAAAVGTPVIAFFGPTVRAFGFYPQGDGHRVLEIPELSCRPCSLHGGSRCPQGHFRCMLGVDAARVVAALEVDRPNVSSSPAVVP